MIVTFIGHAKLNYSQKAADKLLEVLEDQIESQDVTFYMGLNGNFDLLARECCLNYKRKYGNAKLIFVTPYMDEAYLKKLEFLTKDFDGVLYPHLETVPKRYAIAARNKFMIDRSNMLIAYASYVFGNTHHYIHYAWSRYKQCINLDEYV